MPRLLIRYLAACLLLVLASVVGTVWLAQTSEYRYDQQVSDLNLARDQQVIDALTIWAGSHADWDDVGPMLLRLSQETGRRIALVDGAGKVIADTAPGLPRPQPATRLLDPLQILADPLTLDSRLHEGVNGPFLLDDAQRGQLARQASAVVECLGDAVVETAVWGSGRPVVAGFDDAPDCGRAALNSPLPTERAALDDVRDRMNVCLLAAGEPPVTDVELDLSPSIVPSYLALRSIRAAGDVVDDITVDCLMQARSAQAAATTAPAVHLVITDERGDERGLLDASPGSIARTAAVVAALSALLAAAAALIIVPTLRSARRLEVAVDRFSAGDRDARTGLRARDDLADVGAAFDRMSAEIAGHEASRRRLLGDIAHELRSPLTNIRGWVEAADDGLGLDDAELHRLVLDEAGRMERITGDLQLLALAESGDLQLERTTCDAAGIVRELFDAHRARAATAGITLTVDAPPVLPLRTDPARLRQILDNLLANALRHTPTGGHVSLEARVSEGRVRIAVVDDGEGIPSADLPRVFDRLWRGEPSRVRAGESTGLGLSIARGLAEALGGTLDAQSTLGEGSRFELSLPAQA
ncbi:sensor histidine kinase [Microbacterium sp. ANT_H45B]|uniref:sensor histidine kinase n=1 Tax=Microbacterium sp. ANT_H45B TaxID=2597346 RepID=UPI00165DCB15|nr:HAMP domain-containing sensor histidine kinase [Microbacterium sp. ANT_H45B]